MISRLRTWQPPPLRLGTPRSSGVETRSVTVAGLFEVTTWILGFGAAARAVSPKALVENVKKEIARMAAAYGRRKGV